MMVENQPNEQELFDLSSEEEQKIRAEVEASLETIRAENKARYNYVPLEDDFTTKMLKYRICSAKSTDAADEIISDATGLGEKDYSNKITYLGTNFGVFNMASCNAAGVSDDDKLEMDYYALLACVLKT